MTNDGMTAVGLGVTICKTAQSLVILDNVAVIAGLVAAEQPLENGGANQASSINRIM